MDHFRHLEVGQPFAAVGLKRLNRRLGLQDDGGVDFLAVLGIWSAEGGDNGLVEPRQLGCFDLSRSHSESEQTVER